MFKSTMELFCRNFQTLIIEPKKEFIFSILLFTSCSNSQIKTDIATQDLTKTTQSPHFFLLNSGDSTSNSSVGLEENVYLEIGSLSKLITQIFLQSTFTQEELLLPLPKEFFDQFYPNLIYQFPKEEWCPSLQDFLHHRSGIVSQESAPLDSLIWVLYPANCAYHYDNINAEIAARWFEVKSGQNFESARLEFVRQHFSTSGFQKVEDQLPLGAGGLGANFAGLTALYKNLNSSNLPSQLTWQATGLQAAKGPYFHAGQTNRFSSELYLDPQSREGFLLVYPWSPFQDKQIPENIKALKKRFRRFTELNVPCFQLSAPVQLEGTWQSPLIGEVELQLTPIFNATSRSNYRVEGLLEVEDQQLLYQGNNTWQLTHDPGSTEPQELALRDFLGEFSAFECENTRWLVWKKSGRSWVME